MLLMTYHVGRVMLLMTYHVGGVILLMTNHLGGVFAWPHVVRVIIER